ncbi:MAG TPA: hypothetical protein VLL03_06860 [Burkholderiales bacterium]|nr:hypothetical protein [Burkholderiales bacterium]
MGEKPQTISQQLHSNLVAIISLVVALSGLFYNNWREKVIEENRSIRIASFEVLKNLGELQLVVDYAHYQKNKQLGNPITGWGRVLLIKDLAQVIPDPVTKTTEELYRVWGAEFEKIESDEKSVERVTQAINTTRQSVLQALSQLK